MGVGFQLNMIDEETLLSAGFELWIPSEGRVRDGDKYFRPLFVYIRRARRALFLIRLQSDGVRACLRRKRETR